MPRPKSGSNMDRLDTAERRRNKLEQLLEKSGWERMSAPGGPYWEKGLRRLFVDEIGVFHYQYRQGQWGRVRGLAHQDILLRHLKEYFLKFGDGYRLNLI